MMKTILNAWTIFAGLVTVGLGAWICVGNLIVGVAMMVLGLVVLGLGVFLVQEGARRNHLAEQVPAVGRVLPAASRSSRRDAPLNRRKVA